MKIVLIYAKSQAIRQKAAEVFADENVTKGELARDEIYPPLGISILAAELEQLGHEVKLFDDSIEWAKKLHAAGVPFELEIGDGLWHAWAFFSPLVPESEAALRRAGDWLAVS